MKHWTAAEVTRMKRLRLQGLSRAGIATELGRSEDAVKAQLGRTRTVRPVKKHVCRCWKCRREIHNSPRILIGVSGHFSAAHRDQTTGEIHGHTWHVLAKFETPTRVNSVCARAALRTLLAVWDHTMLPDNLAWGEDIAAAVGTLANCVEVQVSRPEEGFYVWWFA